MPIASPAPAHFPVRVPAPARAARPSAVPALARACARAVLRAPLAVKLAGANAVIVLAAVGAVAAARGAGAAPGVALVAAAALGASAVANVALVSLALRPLRALEEVAARVWRGDLAARAESSPLADRDVARVGDALNLALGAAAEQGARARALADAVVRAAELERGRVARELHDVTAQSLAALTYQLSALERESLAGEGGAPPRPALAADLGAATAAARALLEEVRTLAETMHPRVLDDLGLVPALHHLVRAVRRQAVEGPGAGAAPPAVTLDVPDAPPALAEVAALTLYRVAHEAVTNALRHGAPSHVAVRLALAADAVTLTVADDGRGFDLADAEARRPGMGLFVMRERVALLDGRTVVDTAPGRGTRVTAAVPLHPADGAAEVA